MASLIFKNSNKSKGILIFKNNELSFLHEEYLQKLSEKFFLGLYFGSFQQTQKVISDKFSFTISAKGLIDNFYNTPHINLQGWNFSSSKLNFQSKENIPIYEIQSLAFNGLRKQLRHILLFFKLYLERFPYSKARIFAIHNPYDPLHDKNIGGFYESKIPQRLKDRLILHKLDCYSSQKLTSFEIRTALTQSKINVIASRDEGAPRILSESLCLQRPVLLSNITKMSSTDEINSHAFQKFFSSEDFVKKASSLQKISQNYNPYELYPEFFLENSIEKLSSELQKICNVEKELIISYYYKNNLNKLKSHYLTGHSKVINFNQSLDDDVCTDELDVSLLCQKLLKEKIVFRNIEKKRTKFFLYEKFRKKLYYLKVRLIYKLNTPINSDPEELNKKHFKNFSSLI